MFYKLFTDFHLLRPWWLLALLPLCWLVFLFIRRHFGNSRWEAVCDAALLPYILSGRAVGRRYYLVAIVTICGVLSVLALAGPTWERLPQPVFRDDNALVIAMDLSRSMDAFDIKPNRLARARFKVADLLKMRGGGQTALLVYAGSAFTVAPLTDDVNTIAMQLPALTTSLMPTQGSNVAAALKHAITLFKRAGKNRGNILLVTDGIDDDYSAQQFARARKQGYLVSILAIGTQQGSPIRLPDGSFLKDQNGAIVLPATDAAVLKKSADAGGGIYIPIQADSKDIDTLQLFFDRRLLKEDTTQTELYTSHWREQGPYLLLLILPLAAFAFRRGYIALFILCAPALQPVHAVEWETLWLNEDQQAMRQFNAGNFAASAERFSDPAWKAAAKYRAGDYAGSAALLADATSKSGLYNAANALAKQGKYEEALALYERVLTIDSSHQAAQHNRQLIIDALQRQQHAAAQDQPSTATNEGQQNTKAARQQNAKDNGNENKKAATQQASSTPDKTQTATEKTQSTATASALDQRAAQPVTDQTEAAAAQKKPQADQIDEATSKTTTAEQKPTTTTDAASRLPQKHAPDEAVQATEQWLRRIPDDPAALLRRKFYFQYQNQAAQKSDAEQAWQY